MVRQQDELVAQLQDQHYEQYMEHVHSQLLLHQRQQFAQLHSLPVAVETSSPGNQLVEFHTEADVAAETCHHDDVVAGVMEGEMNGASDVALLAATSVGDEQCARVDEEDADDSDVDDHHGTLAGNCTGVAIAGTRFCCPEMDGQAELAWKGNEGKEEYLYIAFLHQGTHKALRHGSHSFTCKQHHACLSFVAFTRCHHRSN